MKRSAFAFAALTVLVVCGNQSELKKLTIISKEIQVQVEAMKPQQNVVELKLP